MTIALIGFILLIVLLLILAWIAIDALAASLQGDARLYGILKFLVVVVAILLIAQRAGLL